jgi:hypothetical protein
MSNIDWRNVECRSDGNDVGCELVPKSVVCPERTEPKSTRPPPENGYGSVRDNRYEHAKVTSVLVLLRCRDSCDCATQRAR